MLLTWPAIQYTINISYIIGICTTNFLIPETDAELMGGHRRTREIHDSLCFREFPINNLILLQYILSAWRLHLLDVLGHYFI